MRDIKDLCTRIEDELSKIADNRLNTGNLEMTYKLIDMYKDIKKFDHQQMENFLTDVYKSGYQDVEVALQEVKGIGPVV